MLVCGAYCPRVQLTLHKERAMSRCGQQLKHVTTGIIAAIDKSLEAAGGAEGCHRVGAWVFVGVLFVLSTIVLSLTRC